MRTNQNHQTAGTRSRRSLTRWLMLLLVGAGGVLVISAPAHADDVIVDPPEYGVPQPDAPAPKSSECKRVKSLYAEAPWPLTSYSVNVGMLFGHAVQKLDGSVSVWTDSCDNGHVSWTSSVQDYGIACLFCDVVGTKADFIKSELVLRTRLGHTIHVPNVNPGGTSNLTIDLYHGDYPIDAKFYFSSQYSLGGGTFFGFYNRTCSLHAKGASNHCDRSNGYGDWSIG